MIGTRNKYTNEKIRRTLLRGVGWFTSVIALLLLLTACGGGAGDNTPPLTSAASLRGLVTFTDKVPLGEPPWDVYDGQPPAGVRFGARIVDPGDDIGQAPKPKPVVYANGQYVFNELIADPLTYFNLRFNLNVDLETGLDGKTPVSFNLPVYLEKGGNTYLTCEIDRPFPTVLEVVYQYNAPNGSREVRMQLDFSKDLIIFDIDGDGLYDDMVAIDSNHDTIPDENSGLMTSWESLATSEASGLISGIGAHSISIGGTPFEVWDFTDINSSTGNTISLAECAVGHMVYIRAIKWGTLNVAYTVDISSSYATPYVAKSVQREGIIEAINDLTLYVAGIVFYGYANADLTDSSGGLVLPGELEIGQSINITGTRDHGIISADSIVVNFGGGSQYIEREGPIISFSAGPVAGSLMTVDGIEFELIFNTLVRDLAGRTLDFRWLIEGSPVWVYGHRGQDSFIADIIELQYTVAAPGTEKSEVVVLYDDPSLESEITTAIAGFNTEISIAAVPVAHLPVESDAPPCLQELVSDMLFEFNPIVDNLPGVIETFPRSLNDQCSAMVLIEESYADTIKWIDVFFPDGVKGFPIEYDLAYLPPVYGAGPDLRDAKIIADSLIETFKNTNGVLIYISPTEGFEQN